MYHVPCQPSNYFTRLPFGDLFSTVTEEWCGFSHLYLMNAGNRLTSVHGVSFPVSLLTPNDAYSGRTAPLTSKFAFFVFIQQI